MDIMTGLPTSRLSAKARHEILLVVKEAVNNTVRHSRATELWFRMRFADRDLIISVEDNGCGFDALAAGGTGNGLGNMRERMKSIGGRLALSSRPGGGTAVSFHLPLRAND